MFLRIAVTMILGLATAALGACGGAPHASNTPGASTPTRTPRARGPWRVSFDQGWTALDAVAVQKAAAQRDPPPTPELGLGFVPASGATRVLTPRQLLSVPKVVDAQHQPSGSTGAHGRLLSPLVTRPDGAGIAVVFDASYGRGEGRLLWEPVTKRGLLLPPHTLAKPASFPSVAVNRRGDAIVTWTASVPSEGQQQPVTHVRAAVRPAGGRFGPPVDLSAIGVEPYADGNGPTGNAVAGAINDRGQLFVVAETYDGREAGVRGWRGTVSAGFDRAPLAIGGPGANGEAFDVAIDDAARAYVVWTFEASGEDADGPLTVQAASVAPGASTATIHTLEHGKAVFPPAFAQLESDPSGGAVVAWNGTQSSNPKASSPLKLLTIDRDGTFGRYDELAPVSGLSGLGVGPRGEVVVTWSNLDDRELPASTWARVRSAGAADFGPTERLPLPDGAPLSPAVFDAHGTPTLAAVVPDERRGLMDHLVLLKRAKP